LNVFSEKRGLIETALNSTDKDSKATGGIVNISFNFSSQISASILYGRENFTTPDNNNVNNINVNSDVAYKQLYNEFNLLYSSRKNVKIDMTLRKTQQIDSVIRPSGVAEDYIENSASIKFTYSL